MSLPAPVVTVVREYLRAMIESDLPALGRVALPDPDLGMLAARLGAEAEERLLAELVDLQIDGEELQGERFLVRARFEGIVHLLLLRTTPSGPRIDARYAIASRKPQNQKQRAARAFYLALLVHDLEALRALSFDAHGVELLAEGAPPTGERAQLDQMAERLAVIELAQGESFPVPTGIEFVGARHAEMGIAVLSGLGASGEIPFLLRQKEHQWRVIPFHFVQKAALARAGAIKAR